MRQSISDLISSLPGVVGSAFVHLDDIPFIKSAEETDQKNHFVPLINLGIREVLQRQNLLVLLKDSTFRGAPGPTVYMVEDTEDDSLPQHMILRTHSGKYRIVGEEVMDKKTKYTENHVFFENDFVIFPERRKNRQHVPAFLIIPPIAFPELEEKKDTYNIHTIMSVSPSTPCDEFLRQTYHFPKLPELATILVGWDDGI